MPMCVCIYIYIYCFDTRSCVNLFLEASLFFVVVNYAPQRSGGHTLQMCIYVCVHKYMVATRWLARDAYVYVRVCIFKDIVLTRA